MSETFTFQADRALVPVVFWDEARRVWPAAVIEGPDEDFPRQRLAFGGIFVDDLTSEFVITKSLKVWKRLTEDARTDVTHRYTVHVVIEWLGSGPATVTVPSGGDDVTEIIRAAKARLTSGS